MGFNPFWSYNENTETYNNRETGGSVNAGGADALDRIAADYTSLSSKGEAYEALGYSRKVLDTDGLGNQEVLYTDPMGKLSVKKEPFWEITGTNVKGYTFINKDSKYRSNPFLCNILICNIDISY